MTDIDKAVGAVAYEPPTVEDLDTWQGPATIAPGAPGIIISGPAPAAPREFS